MRSSIRPGRLGATAAAVILCTSLVTACSSSTPQDASSGTAGVDVTDLTGATVHLDQTAQRVVTIPLLLGFSHDSKDNPVRVSPVMILATSSPQKNCATIPRTVV